MRKRLMIGGVVLAAALLATFFSGLFNGLGTGGQNGNGALLSTAGDDSSAPDSSRDRPADNPKTPGFYEKPGFGTLEVLIDGQSYALRGPGVSETRPIELPELVELAKNSRGDETGIRVRVFRRQSSLVTAEIALTDALREAGFSEERGNVHWEDQLLK